MKLSYLPLGVYFSESKPEGKIRSQGKLINRCIVNHVFKAAKNGKISLIQKGIGCPGGLYWAGLRKKIIKGWASFITKGKDTVLGGRAEHFKKDAKVAVQMLRDPGPVNLPEGANYIIYRPLREIPDTQLIEFIVFFVNPKGMAQLITLCNYGRHVPYMVRAPSGSGCMSLLNYPLELKHEPEPDAVMGIWDLYAITTIPKNLLTLTLRRWYVEEMAQNIPESFLTHTPPFTTWGELKLFFKKVKKRIKK